MHRQQHRTIRTILAVALAFVAALGLAVAVPSSASAGATRSALESASWGWAQGTYYNQYNGENARDYLGEVGDALTDGWCVELKRRRITDGAWTRSGITGGQSCTTQPYPISESDGIRYSITDDETVANTTGLRLYRGDGTYLTLCGSKAACLDM